MTHGTPVLNESGKIMAHLFTPKKVGAYTLSHRVVLAPMTRLRTIQPGDIPSPMMADFYGQRASQGGLEIIEGVSISIPARSYLGAASFYHDGQMEGWKAIANAVHAKGGRAFMQLIHGGRQSHVEMTGGVDPVAPSVVPFEGVALTKDGFRARVAAPGARDRRDPGHHRGVPRRGSTRARCRLRRRRTSWRQRLPGRPVHPGRHQQAHGRLRRPDREPRPLPARSRRGADLGVGRRPGWRAHLAVGRMGRHLRQQSGGHLQLRREGARRVQDCLPACDRAAHQGRRHAA